jgi:hypothetical protein
VGVNIPVPDPARGSVSADRGLAVQRWASTRKLYLDQLKIILIAAIIATHGVLGYLGSDQLWSYADVQEVTLSPVTEAAMFVVVGPFALFVIPLLFMVAGLLSPRSLEHKGAGRFARDRLLRLGVPFFAFVLLLQPLLMYALYHPLGAAPGSYWDEFLDEGRLDAGPMWFVGVLLIFSLAYAGWVRLRQHSPVRTSREITAVHLVLIAAAVAPLSFLVRVIYPFGSESGFSDLNLWEWPACLALFAFGITASAKGWLDAVPDQLRRQSRTVTLVAVAVLMGFVASVDALGVAEEHLWGGWHWPALAFAALEGIVVVFGPVWLLGEAQRHLNRESRWAGPAISRSAYAAFLLQGFLLIGLAVALRPVPVMAEVKALVVASGGVAGSFAFAWLLLTRVRFIGLIL